MSWTSASANGAPDESALFRMSLHEAFELAAVNLITPGAQSRGWTEGPIDSMALQVGCLAQLAYSEGVAAVRRSVLPAARDSGFCR